MRFISVFSYITSNIIPMVWFAMLIQSSIRHPGFAWLQPTEAPMRRLSIVSCCEAHTAGCEF